MVCKILKQILVTLVLYHPVSVICGTVTPTNGNNTVSGVKGKSIDLQWDINAGQDENIKSVEIFIAAKPVSSFFLTSDDPKTLDGDKPVSYMKDRLKVSYHSKDAKKSGTVTLSITNLNYQDKHNFTCAVTFFKDITDTKVVVSEIHIININEMPHFCEGEPLALERIFESSSIRKSIHVCGNPPPKLTWKISDKLSGVVEGRLWDSQLSLYHYKLNISGLDRSFCGHNLSMLNHAR